jgi:putative SOS response-associated peptidase YedK
MCGRFAATFEFSNIRVRWYLDRDLSLYKPRFNIAPEQTSPTIPVIIRHEDGNECRLMHWGLIPHWAADPSIGNRMIIFEGNNKRSAGTGQGNHSELQNTDKR